VGRIITLASWKGGASKTAITTILAVHLAHRGYRVAVVDADPARHFASWHRIYEGPLLACTVENREVAIVEHVQQQNADQDVTLVDTAAINRATVEHCIRISDLVLIPMLADRASVVDAIRTARETEVIARATGHDIAYRLVKSRWNPRGMAERWLLEDIHRHAMPVIEQHISQLADFGKMTLTGVVPVRGVLSQQANAIIDELIAMGAVAPAPGG
jgi:chromosome partitioning protein